ncbi:MAG: helix-turn-helix domain-containing protein [Ruminococcaceae bacterium]|nr:helix-turn-helix domain-containing protein [Oscillospiraceae bacterium]
MMSIGSTIKKLRRERDMTQEQLAEYLGITANAVSQWECDRTAPDISQLPILANFFEVTTDYLLGVDVTNKQAAIDHICNEAWNLCNSGDKEGAAQIIRNALVSYPNSFKMMSDLTIFLYQRAFQQKCSPEEHHSLCREAADYIDKIIAGCNDMKIQGQAIELACTILPVVGRYNDALRLISNIPDISKDEMLTSLYSGSKLIEHTKDIICKSVSAAADQTIWLASLNKDDGSPLFDENKKIKLYEKAISFHKTLYEAGDYFFDAESLAEAEKQIANIYASRKDTENVLYHLGECVKYVIMFDTYDETRDTYTSLIPSGRVPVGINWNNKWNKSHEMLMRLNDDTDYDFIRDNSEFKNLIKQLKQTDNTL